MEGGCKLQNEAKLKFENRLVFHNTSSEREMQRSEKVKKKMLEEEETRATLALLCIAMGQTNAFPGTRKRLRFSARSQRKKVNRGSWSNCEKGAVLQSWISIRLVVVII